MAKIETGDADSYVKQLISEQFHNNTDEDNDFPEIFHFERKIVPGVFRDIFENKKNQ